MSLAREFLDLYNELERLLKSKYPAREGRFSSPVIQYANETEGRHRREELELCREVRNLLSHNSRYDGEDLVAPSERLTETLREIIREIENPPTALSICTPTEKLLLATGCEHLHDIVRAMEQNGFSNVPILDHGMLRGVFSASTLLDGMSGEKSQIDSDSEISKLADYLPPNAHSYETYRFASADATYYELKEIFAPKGPRHARVAAVFVTSDGTANGKVLGMVTPWDMLRAFPE